MDGRIRTPLELVQPKEIRSGNPVGSLDGNTVDLEREMVKLAENQLGYQFMTQLISRKVLMLRAVIKEGEG